VVFVVLQMALAFVVLDEQGDRSFSLYRPPIYGICRKIAAGFVAPAKHLAFVFQQPD
jgi:hypothetical protein